MSQFDDQLPEDVRDIAARLFAARVNPTPLRSSTSFASGFTGAPVSRRGGAVSPAACARGPCAVLLTAGLMLTSGAGVVFASDWFGGNNWNGWSAWPIFHHDRDAAWCQYHGPEDDTPTAGTRPTRS